MSGNKSDMNRIRALAPAVKADKSDFPCNCDSCVIENTAIKEAYHSVPCPALGLSDYCLAHFIPTYRQKLKSAKPVLRSVKRWTNEAEQDLKVCFDLTDWTVFEAAANDLDELTETVTSYISLCEDMCIPTRTHLTYNNDKPWFFLKHLFGISLWQHLRRDRLRKLQ